MNHEQIFEDMSMQYSSKTIHWECNYINCTVLCQYDHRKCRLTLENWHRTARRLYSIWVRISETLTHIDIHLAFWSKIKYGKYSRKSGHGFWHGINQQIYIYITNQDESGLFTKPTAVCKLWIPRSTKRWENASRKIGCGYWISLDKYGDEESTYESIMWLAVVASSYSVVWAESLVGRVARILLSACQTRTQSWRHMAPCLSVFSSLAPLASVPGTETWATSDPEPKPSTDQRQSENRVSHQAVNWDKSRSAHHPITFGLPTNASQVYQLCPGTPLASDPNKTRLKTRLTNLTGNSSSAA